MSPDSHIKNNPMPVSSRTHIFQTFADRLGKPDLPSIVTPESPWVCFSNEFGVSDLPAAGGLGYLAGDWMMLSGRLGIPFAGVGLYYKTRWSQVFDSTFRQTEKYYTTPHPSFYKFKKLKINNRYISFPFYANDHKAQIEIFIKHLQGNPLIMLYEAGLKGLYEGNSADEHRLYQSAVLGFAGVFALFQLNITPSLLHLNESSTVIAAIAMLDKFCCQGVNFDGALKKVRDITLFTNHTLSPAAEPVWRYDQIERYLQKNLKCPDVIKWLGEFISERINGVCFCDLAYLLSGKVNAVSKIHAQKAGVSFGRPFKSITNAISFRWVNKEIMDKYKSKQILCPNTGMLGENYKSHLGELKVESMWKLKEKCRKHLRRYLKSETRNQYGEVIVIPRGAKIAVWARRMDEYKRPFLLFKNPQRLSDVLMNNNIHLILSGKAHPNAVDMKNSMRELFSLIDGSSELKKRVHFVKDYGWKLAKPLVMGADIWINTPRVGAEACGTSWEKAVLNWALLCTTPDGGVADIFFENKYSCDKAPFFLVEGENDDNLSALSLYKNLEEIGGVFKYRQRWYSHVIGQLKAFLETGNGSRMMGEYLLFAKGKK